MAKPTTRASKAQQRAEEPSDEEQQSHEDVEEQQVSGSDAEEEEEEDHEAPASDDDEEEDDGESQDEDGDSDGSAGIGDVDEYPVDAEEEGDDEELEAVGFGDAMSKILQQNVGEDAAPILAKRTTARMREIQNEKKEIKKDRVGAAEKRAKERKDNVVPSHATATKDRQLRKIATKGVVALFNAISKHQHQTGKVADKDDKKVKELSKENFLGLLKGTTQKDKASTPAKTEQTKSSWSVLQDDYMMGAKLKDWDATHANNDSARARRRGNDQGDESDPEAAEEKAWKQVAALDSDDEGKDSKDMGKRKPSGSSSTQKKKVKRS